MIHHLIQKPHKFEPTSILYLRRFVILMLLSLTIALFVILCSNVINEQTTLSSSFVPVKYDSLPTPGKNNY